jgi:hypothetical protein
VDRFLWGVMSSPSIFSAQSTQYIIHGRLASNDANPLGRISFSPNMVKKATCLVLSSGGVGCVSPYSQTLAVCARTSVERVMTRGIALSCWEGVLREENVIFLRVGARCLLWRALGDGRANNGAAMVVLFAVKGRGDDHSAEGFYSCRLKDLTKRTVTRNTTHALKRGSSI